MFLLATLLTLFFNDVYFKNMLKSMIFSGSQQTPIHLRR